MSIQLRKIFGQIKLLTNQAGRATDSTVRLPENLLTDQVEELKQPEPDPQAAPEYLLEPGDLVAVFKTVTDGEVQWKGAVKFDWKRNTEPLEHGGEAQTVLGRRVRGLHDGMAPEEWMAMFLDRLPAKLEHGPRVCYGSLTADDAPGNNSVIWCVAEYGKKGYNNVAIASGDRLTVYRTVTEGDVQWQGRVEFVPAKDDGEKPVLTTVPKGVSEKDWRRMARDRSPAVVYPARQDP